MYYTNPKPQGKVGMTKAQNYAIGIHKADYDIRHALIAHGPTMIRNLVEFLIDELEENEAAIRAARKAPKPRYRVKSRKAA